MMFVYGITLQSWACGGRICQSYEQQHRLKRYRAERERDKLSGMNISPQESEVQATD